MCDFELAKRIPANSKMATFGKLYLLVLNQLKGDCSKHFFQVHAIPNYPNDFSAFHPQPIPILFIIWFYILIWPHIHFNNKLVLGRAPRCSSIPNNNNRQETSIMQQYYCTEYRIVRNIFILQWNPSEWITHGCGSLDGPIHLKMFSQLKFLNLTKKEI